MNLSISKISWLAIILLGLVWLAIYQPKSSLPNRDLPRANQPEIVASDLLVPWGMAFLPNGDLLVTERVSFPDNFFVAGKLTKVTPDGNKTNIPVPAHPNGVEQGLRDVLLHPNFVENNWLYLYLTLNEDGNTAKVMRYRYDNEQLTEPVSIITDIPGGPFQDGGRMLFGADGMLYITSGDGAQEETSQDLNNLAGKIIRLHDDGTVPESNPLKTAIYSYGHRNPQGIAWDSQGQLWSSEHGPKEGLDEINLIEPGGNYGWPESRGDYVAPATVAPLLHSGPEAWAPGSLAYVDNYLVWGGLRSEAIFVAKLTGTAVSEPIPLFTNQYGRIRTVVLGPDEHIYFTTSNRDYRADVRANDDKIYRIHQDAFLELIQQ